MKKNFYQLPTRGKKLTQSKVSNAFNNNVFVSKSKMVFERKSFFPSKRHQDVSSFGFHRTLKPFFVCKLARCPFRETSSILSKVATPTCHDESNQTRFRSGSLLSFLKFEIVDHFKTCSSIQTRDQLSKKFLTLNFNLLSYLPDF